MIIFMEIARLMTQELKKGHFDTLQCYSTPLTNSQVSVRTILLSFQYQVAYCQSIDKH